MNINKYAFLPDIDTAPDVYETEDASPSDGGDGRDDDEGIPSRPSVSAIRGGKNDMAREEFDTKSLMTVNEAGKKFRKAEKKRDTRNVYTYPPSPTSPTFPEESRNLSTRMRMLQDELSALEAEISDPSNPLLNVDSDGNRIDAGELIKNLVDVRGRLEKVKKGREGRLKLIDMASGRDKDMERKLSDVDAGKKDKDMDEPVTPVEENAPKLEKQNASVAGIDKRISALETLVGSSSLSLDEASPLPAPLLPMFTKLNTQLTLLTQPRQLDSISRRLKLLLSDLDRMPSSHAHQTNHRRQSSHHAPNSPIANINANANANTSTTSAIQDQLAPLLTRLAPHLAHIPHILARLRTLSALHNSANEFQSTLDSLEEEQRRVRGALGELREAVESVEVSFEDNGGVVVENIRSLEERVEVMMKRIDQLS